MEKTTLDNIKENNFIELKNTNKKIIICDSGILNYCLLKNKSEYLEGKEIYVYDEKLFNKIIKGEQKINNKKVINIKNYSNYFNISVNENVYVNIYIYEKETELINEIKNKECLLIKT